MAQKTDIRLRRSDTAGKIPTSANLSDGELAINTNSGAVYFKKSNDEIVTVHDNTILYIDSDTTVSNETGSNPKVGIGTTSPTETLHVMSGVSNDTVAIISGSQSDRGLTISTYASDGRTDGGVDLDAYKSFKFTTDGTERARIDSSGNFGIGTDSPATNLEISGSNPKLRITDTRNQSFTVGDIMSSIEFDSDDVSGGAGTSSQPRAAINMYATTTFGSSTGLEFRTKTDSTDYPIQRMVIGANGKVGIGTSSPSANLHVSSTGDTILKITSADGNGAFLDLGDASDTDGGRIVYDSGSNLAFYTASTERARIDSSGNLAIGNTSAAAKLDIRQDSGSAIRCEDGSGAYFVVKQGGLVGIGTPSPDAPLTVHNSSDPEIRFGYSSTQDHKIAWDSSKVFIHADPENANGSSAIGFSVDGTERARIDSSGNLLVGKTSANIGTVGHQLLSDSGGDYAAHTSNGTRALLLNRLTSDGEILDFRKDGTSVGSIGTVGADVTIGTGDTGLRFRDEFDAIQPHNITTNGTVNGVISLGKIGAAFKDLHLSGVANAAGFQSNQAINGFGYVNFGDTDDANIGQIGYDHTNNYMRFQVNNTEKVRIDSSGNVGIGETSPDGKLHIKGGTATGDASHILFENTQGSKVFAIGGGATGVTNNNLFFRNVTDNTRPMVITDAGNVGIGTSSPQQQLTIGTLETSSIITHGTVGIKTASDNKAINIQENSGAEGWGFGVDSSGNLNFYDSASTDPSVTFKDNGGVGIGTSSPARQLEVDFTGSTIGARFTRSDTTGSSTIEFANSAGVKSVIGFNAGNNNFDIQNGGAVRLAVSNTGAITFNEAFTFPTSIGSAGQVLKVPASGTTLQWADQTGGGGSTDSISDADGDTKIQVEESADEDTIRFDTAGTERMLISASGDVSMNRRLYLAGTGQEFIQSAGSLRIDIDHDNNQTDRIFVVSKHNAGTELMRVEENGNVGIGTTHPDSRLDVTGGDITVNTTGTGFMNFKYSDSSKGTIGTDGIDLKITAAADLQLLPTGNVGIGVTTPAAKLHIVNNSTDDTLLLSSTENSSSAAPVLTFNRDSASPADADYLGQLKFKGENDADQDVVYAKITAKILDASDGSEDGLIEFANRKAGSNVITARLRSDSLQLLNGTSLSVAGDATITGNLTVDGTTTTLNTATLDVEDKNITLNYGSGDTSATADGAGITIQDAVDASTNATILWDGTNDEFDFSHTINVTGNINGSRFIQTGTSGNSFYGAQFTRSGGGITSPDLWGSNGTLVIGSSSETEALAFSSTDSTFYGELTIPSKIRHSGDTDNYFSFAAADTQSFVTGNSTRLQITNSLVRLNQEGTNQDFQVFGQNNDNLIFADASTDRVGIGTGAPSSLLHIKGADANLIIQDTSGSYSSQIASLTLTGSLTGGAPRTDVQHKIKLNGDNLTFTNGTNDDERMRIEKSTLR